MRVLIVDDEVRFATALGRGLTAEGFVVELAHDGPTGLDAALTGRFDVIVLDIMLPGIGGYEIVRQIRRHRVWTPVLMLSAKDGEYDQADALDLGADDYLTKPFSSVILLARLRALLRRTAPERPAILSAAGLTLDPARREVRRGSTLITLTPREYGVLNYLMRHVDIVVSKAEILESVWDLNYDGGQNVVEIYIGYVRRKIDAPFGADSIETVRGVGYRLRAEH